MHHDLIFQKLDSDETVVVLVCYEPIDKEIDYFTIII